MSTTGPLQMRAHREVHRDIHIVIVVTPTPAASSAATATAAAASWLHDRALLPSHPCASMINNIMIVLLLTTTTTTRIPTTTRPGPAHSTTVTTVANYGQIWHCYRESSPSPPVSAWCQRRDSSAECRHEVTIGPIKPSDIKGGRREKVRRVSSSTNVVDLKRCCCWCRWKICQLIPPGATTRLDWDRCPIKLRPLQWRYASSAFGRWAEGSGYERAHIRNI